MTKPRLPIPAPQRGIEPGTWAHKTVSERFKATAGRILQENRFPPQTEAQIQALVEDIPEAAIRRINDPQAGDTAAWNRNIEPWLGQNWLQPPWFSIEHYFYRRILEATGYFGEGEGRSVDPFLFQKQTSLSVSRGAIRDLMLRIDSWLCHNAEQPEILRELLYLDLWGNQADLSLWPAEGENKPDHADLEDAQAHILVDHIPQVADFITGLDPHRTRIDILLDNAGYELVCDLSLCDYVLTARLASSICLHVKPHPTYVSDAMEKDVRAAIDFFQTDGTQPAKAAGERLQSYLTTGRLVLREDYFWTSPLNGWEMPDALRVDLSNAQLVISKGDAHYRRLLGDRHWPFTTPFDDILSYFPAPLLALRTLKSELASGLMPGRAETVAAQDPNWMINGRWGVAQFAIPTATRSSLGQG